MLLPLNWLKQFIKIEKTPEQIAEKLTLSGSKVERIIRPDEHIGNVVVGELLEIRKHSNADRLSVAKVNIGNKKIQVVFGQKAVVKVGDKVPVAVAPTRLPGGEIKKTEFRGERSEGMLCLDSELIMGAPEVLTYFPVGTKVGTKVTELLELNDPILELEITPNRADCFSVRGLAREVAALFGRELRVQRFELREGRKRASEVVSVEVKDKELCPKYTARVIENVTVQPSPLWLQNKLRQVGIKAINNVVDVTNYVMMELGQPLHAFEAASLHTKGHEYKHEPARIVVRRARKGERILALDGNTYNLNDSMLVIADEKKPIAIAGVMGGEESGVKESTKTVILEGAIFDSVSIRKTSRVLGLRSESSARFEKGVDPVVVEEASNRAAAMIAELTGGTVLKGIVSFVGVPQGGAPSVKISPDEIARLLGVDVLVAKIKKILQSLGFIVSGSGQSLSIKVPSWRPDVTQAADLAEEIGRMLDYNTLPKTLPSGSSQSPMAEPSQELRQSLRRFLTAAGFTEILTYSFYDEKLLALSGVKEKEHIIVANPVNAENKYLRANLLPWMLAKLSQNSSLLSSEQFQLFEIGKVFSKSGSKIVEKWQLVVGLIDTGASDEVLYRRLRGLADGQISIYPKGSVAGMRFRSSTAVLLVDLDELLKNIPDERRVFKPLPYYPFVERDLAMIVPSGVQYKEIEEVMKNFDSLLKSVELFDVYHGLGEGTSLAFRLTFGSTDRTLEAREVEEVMEKLKNVLQKKFSISFR